MSVASFVFNYPLSAIVFLFVKQNRGNCIWVRHLQVPVMCKLSIFGSVMTKAFKVFPLLLTIICVSVVKFNYYGNSSLTF